MEKLVEEFNRVKDANYELRFIYPDEDVRKHLNVINRDLTSSQKSKIKGARATLADLVADISRGDVLLDDLPQEQVAALRAMLSGRAAR